MDRLLQDLRYAVRMLMRSPGFTVVAVLALGLGIGANSAIFSVVNGVVLRPLPYPDSDRLTMVWEQNARRPARKNVVSPANFLDWQRDSRSFEKMAAVVDNQFTLTGGGTPEQVAGQFASHDFFTVLGVQPALGRGWRLEETIAGAEDVVVISHELWQRRFGGDPAVLGSTITLDLEPNRVIGIMPEGFRFDAPDAELWAPMGFDPTANYREDSGRYLRTVARLKPGVTVAQAEADVRAIAKRLELQFPDFNTGWSATAVPLHEQFVGNIRPTLMVLLGTVGFVLLIACVNVANLLLARSAGRKREMAVRAALGAGQGRIVRQLITESLLLALLGGALGLLLALWGIDVLMALAPASLPRLESIGIDLPVLGFTFAVTLCTGILFGLAPALESARLNLSDSLKEGGRNVTLGRRGNRLRGVLVVTEVALALVLLTSAGLMLRSFARLQAVEPGFDPKGLLTVQLQLPDARYREERQVIGFYEQLLERVRAIPGVVSASAISALPVSGRPSNTNFHAADRPEPPPGQSPGTDVRMILPDYFQTLQIPLKRGRALTAADRDDAANVVVVNEALARQIFPGEDPIGKRLIIPWGDEIPNEIVGVVGDVKHAGLDEDMRPMIYWPHAREPQPGMTLVVRSSLPPLSLVGAVRETVQKIDPDVPLYDIASMEDRIEVSMAGQRFNLLLLGIFAGVALLMASVGIYGVMAWSVTQRSHEIGVRMALGASRGQVLTLVVGGGMRLVLAGVAAGLVGAFALTRLMESLLFQVPTTDPATYLSVAGVLAGVALLACYLPARRATRIDPMISLRND